MTARTLDCSHLTRVALTAAVVILGTTASASAGLLASDSYAIGSNPSAGQYVAYNSTTGAGGLFSGQSSSLANTGFANGGYTGGNGTANWVASSTGLVNAADGSDSSTGSVEFLGGSGIKNVARTMNFGSSFVEGTTGSGSVYFESMLVTYTSTSTTTDGFVLAGIGNSTAPTLGTTSGNLFGAYVGFSDDSGTVGEEDLVLRARNSANATTADTPLVSNAVLGQTYLVVLEINLRPTSAVSPVTFWVNPTDLSSTTNMTNTAINSGTVNTYGFQGSTATGSTGDFNRLNYYSSDYNGTANFDQVELGTSLASITPNLSSVPEPASIAMTVLGCGGFAFGSYLRRRRSVR